MPARLTRSERGGGKQAYSNNWPVALGAVDAPERFMNIRETIKFIKEVHIGYKEKLGKPYWQHPYRVMRFLGPFTSKEKKQAALLHDVIEDTEYSEEDLLELGFSNKTVDMVEILTHDVYKDTYYVYILKIILSGNFGAMHIKLADLFDFALCELINKFKPS